MTVLPGQISRTTGPIGAQPAVTVDLNERSSGIDCGGLGRCVIVNFCEGFRTTADRGGATGTGAIVRKRSGKEPAP